MSPQGAVPERHLKEYESFFEVLDVFQDGVFAYAKSLVKKSAMMRLYASFLSIAVFILWCKYTFLSLYGG